MAVDAARPNALARLVGFYHAVVQEMKRVTWPDRPQVQQATILITIFVLVVGLIITVMDLTLQGVLVTLLPRLFVGH